MSERAIVVVDYDPLWKIAFEKEKQSLVNALGSNALKIEHIGSTAVPDLAAKPVIDILIEVESLQILDEKNKAIEALGYLVKGENGIASRRYFQKGCAQRSHHVHAFVTNDGNLFRHRAFTAYLIAHPASAREYSQVKKEAVSNCDNNINHYMSLKNDFIEHHERLAVNWFEQITL